MESVPTESVPTDDFRKVQQARRLAGQKGDFDPVERMGDAFTGGFEPGFLACPEIEKSGWFLVLGQGLEGRDFARAKKAGHELLGIVQRPHALEIDADFSRACHRQKSQATGVGQVKVKVAFPAIVHQQWFSIGAVAELDLAGIDLQVMGQDLAQGATSNDEAVPVQREVEAGGSLAFHRREGIVEFSERGGSHIQGDSPNVSFRGGRGPIGWRQGPVNVAGQQH